MVDDLKPCPFCGGEARLKKSSRISKEWGQHIYIQPVPIRVQVDYYKHAIDTWNSRKEA